MNTSPVKITVDGNTVGFESVCYHYQKTPKPGGSHYQIAVNLQDRTIVEYIEKMIGKETNDTGFTATALQQCQTTYNAVEYVLLKLEERSPSAMLESQPAWVFNNITSVDLKTGQLVIRGVASKFIERFGE